MNAIARTKGKFSSCYPTFRSALAGKSIFFYELTMLLLSGTTSVMNIVAAEQKQLLVGAFICKRGSGPTTKQLCPASTDLPRLRLLILTVHVAHLPRLHVSYCVVYPLVQCVKL